MVAGGVCKRQTDKNSKPTPNWGSQKKKKKAVRFPQKGKKKNGRTKIGGGGKPGERRKSLKQKKKTEGHNPRKWTNKNARGSPSGKRGLSKRNQKQSKEKRECWQKKKGEEKGEKKKHGFLKKKGDGNLEGGKVGVDRGSKIGGGRKRERKHEPEVSKKMKKNLNRKKRVGGPRRR